MKNIFRKLHIGSTQDHIRSGEISPAPAVTSGAVARSCASDHQTAMVEPPALPVMTPPSPTGGASATAVERVDYYSTEEEFQMQLALAISASNLEFREDPDSDQIRAATLLSLGKHRDDYGRQEEEASESLARRYWDYNVLDYDEKVVDGFYDIFGLSTNLNHGKMPSLHDLQTSIGDLGFEVIIINRAVDTALVELEQVAHCIALGVPATEVMLLVQRISELVSQNMGGPVRDANDILARWIEKSSELRTSLQTSLLPIGFINVGLSRHRALLFKVLADNIGIPCKLVKGSHYTGVDEDAVNIIKYGDNREFLVDLMAAPGTLIPADVLSMKDASLISYNPLLTQNILNRAIDNSGDGFPEGKNRYCNLDGDNNFDRRASSEKSVLLPSVLGESSTSTASNSTGNKESFYLHGFSNLLLSSFSEASKQEDYKVHEFAFMNEKPKEPRSEDALNSRRLFAELNPFQALGVGKHSTVFELDDNKTNEYQRSREPVALGPGRPQHQSPLVRKNHSPCNDVSSMKYFNFSEEIPGKNLEYRDLNSSRYTSTTTGGSQANPISCSGISCSVSSNDSFRTPDCSSGAFNFGSGKNGKLGIRSVEPPEDKALIPVQFKKHGLALHNNVIHEAKERDKNINAKRDRRFLHDKFMDRNIASMDTVPSAPSAYDRFIGGDKGLQDADPSSSLSPSRSSRIDPMLDDVAEWEIPWEDLVIGERIGLGSYGEVYRADWNDKEVAVKKFLDQDFYGDALDEFRSEVRIMRRLRHPNVVLFMGAVTRPPNLSIVSEFLPRGSLYRILHRPNCQIDEKRRIKMALDVAKGMNCLHTSAPTIVHRDLKSPNLLVDKNWTVKVCDFGLSRLKHNTFLSSKSTAGTPEWMAPEVLRNEPSNEKCDVYSFGVILWELATLRMPWKGMNPMQVVGAVGFQERRLEIPKEVDPLVARIIWECWQTEPSLRPSFAQLTTALKSLQRLVISSHHDTQNPSIPQEIPVNSTP
ncbi:serine/threonine-protein kinase EDR1-like [Dendrobium catenatum]|uniref:non-specific serine/threonine protein kinase n=1 Tax=Dendrobium catenatum TaxID=906689 RepID=A0A2I0WWR3_9ASPA|nr:serine/threonine-protein kinase EDR1-like [Dendrobium catenatum]PKU80100.1 Serine/threonine-protein kinase EDR1 [Dendrobium catenatum]